MVFYGYKHLLVSFKTDFTCLLFFFGGVALEKGREQNGFNSVLSSVKYQEK